MGLEQQLGHASNSIGLPIYILFAVPFALAIVFQIAKSLEKKPDPNDPSWDQKSDYFKRGNRIAALVSLLFLVFAGLFSFQVFTGNIHSLRSVNIHNLAR